MDFINRHLIAMIVILHIIAATVFLLLIPPWQGADETTHFEQIIIFKDKPHEQVDTIMRRSKDIERKLLMSMTEFNFWRYVGYSQPIPLPDTFDKAPFISIVASQRTKPPLYYITCASILQFLPASDYIVYLYSLRFFSLLLSCFILVLADNLSQLLGLKFRQRIMVLFFLIFLPQFNILSVTITTDIFLLLMYLLFFGALFRLDFKRLNCIVLTHVILYGSFCILSDRAGYLTVPIFMFYAILHLRRKNFTYILKTSLWGVFLLTIISPIIAYTNQLVFFKVIDKLTNFYLGLALSKATLLGIHQSLVEFMRILFSSLFCSAGWMKYGIPRELFWIIGGVSAAIVLLHCILWIFRRNTVLQGNRDTNRAHITLLFTVFLFIFTIIYLYWLKGFLAQGRYLFPAIWYIAYWLSGSSLLKYVKSPPLSSIIVAFMQLFYFLLYVFALFFILIPAFYF